MMPNSEEPAIALKNVRFAWRKNEPVLDVPEFSVPRGARIFLEGPSGSGKSTLLSLITGIAIPQSGTVSIFGRELNRLDAQARDAFRADRMGIIFQLFNLLPYLSLIDNALLPCRFSPARAARTGPTATARKKAAIDLLTRLGLGPLLTGHRRVSELSVGQQQRVAAARALVGSPDLIIADEPTSALDASARNAFVETLLMEADRTGATLLFVSHDPALGQHFDQHQSLGEINRATEGLTV